MKTHLMNKTSLLVVLSLAGLSIANLRADQPEQPPVSPAASIAPQPAMMPHPLMRPMNSPGPQAMLTPEESKLLGQARIELQKDPELMELNNQIKALMEKRMKLTEEKLQKLNPEAAALLQKLKAAQEKMVADRKAQMEAMQAKMKAQQEAAQAAAATPASVPAAPPAPIPPTVTATPSP